MKGLDALKALYNTMPLVFLESNANTQCYIDIEKDLKDFEWLKSKVSIDWFDKLSTDDRLRFLKIMGVEYEQSNND